MKVIKPTPCQAALVLKKFLEGEGVTVKLGRAQEAVARMMGYASWNALASDMDPKLGEQPSPGALTQQGLSEYTLSTGPQSSVWITVDNIDVCVKHDDEGVVVDLYPALGDYDESLASTYAMFAEAEQDEEVGTSTDAQPQESALSQARDAQAVSHGNGAPSTIYFKSGRELGAAIDGKRVEPAAIALSFREGKEVRSLTIEALMSAVQTGDFTWRLPSGDSLTFHL